MKPDPLVRDFVRGYRTGKVDRVLAGDFDLFEPTDRLRRGIFGLHP